VAAGQVVPYTVDKKSIKIASETEVIAKLDFTAKVGELLSNMRSSAENARLIK